jgi:hypothetical protein
VAQPINGVGKDDKAVALYTIAMSMQPMKRMERIIINCQ